MCAEAAEVQLASVRRYQGKQEALSAGPMAQVQRNVSQSFLLYSLLSSPLLWVLFIGNSPSRCLCISPISPAQLRLHPCSQGNPLFPAGLFVPLLS